uniref:Uncharacterized protein n=1 Tax=Meloidogyne javanica TaxID=6303 RepID=A0A915LV94_MELJA
MTILKILILFIFYLLIVNAKINGKRSDENFNNIQPDSNENLSNLGINSGKSGGNKKFGKNNKNRNDQKEENKELDIQSKDGSDLYKKFEQLLQQKEQQFRIERQRIAQTKLSRNAQDVDSRIQDLLKNPDIAERTLILQIERILSGTTDNIRQELQRQMPVIGPLDGNLPPAL